MKNLFETHILAVGKSLDLRLQRQNIVMGNLANIKTPGYRARRLEFEEEFQRVLGQSGKGTLTRTQPDHLPVPSAGMEVNGEMLKDLRPRVVQGEDAVDLDKEVAEMSKNSMLYNALVTALTKNFEGIKSVISEGAK